jgi:hypothetical protein
LSRPAAIAIGALLAVLVLAPPGSNAVWAVNGLRSLPVPAAIALLVLAWLARVAVRARPSLRAWWIAAPAIALAIAFGLREKIHFLGDSQMRLRAMAAFTGELVPATLSDWVVRLHASPLDVAVNVFGAVLAHRLGWGLPEAVAVVCALLGTAYLVGAGRVASRLGAADDLRLPLALALVGSGVLQAFAGYAESAGLVAAAGMWWWAEMLAPLKRRDDAIRLAAAWLVLALAHRLGVVMLLPTLARVLLPGPSADRPEGRRAALPILAVAAAVAVLALASGGGGTQLGRDLAELSRTLGARGFAPAPLTDVLNTLLLVAPFAWLAPALAGREALVAFARRPLFVPWLAAVVPLMIGLVWLFPLGASGLGAHRDWDANILLGLALTVGAGSLIASLPRECARAGLAAAVPVLVLLAGGWLAVNATEDAAFRRAVALVSQPPRLSDEQTSHGWMFLGQRAMDLGQARAAADAYDRAFALNPNPRRSLMAAEAWLYAGDVAAARASLAAARKASLSPELETSARAIESAIVAASPVAVPADTTAR